MAALTLTVTNMKGGVGKTTFVVNIAATLGKNNKILILDLDPQRNTTPFYTEVADYKITTIKSVLEGTRKLKNCVVKGKWSDLHVDICKGTTLLNDTGADLEHLKREIETVKDDYDYILIDTRPSAEFLTLSAMIASDMLIVPMELDGYCRDNLIWQNELYHKVQDNYNLELKMIICPNKVRNTKSQIAIYTTLVTENAYPISDSVIRRREKVNSAAMMRKPLIKHSVRDEASQDFEALCSEIVEKLEVR